VWGRGKEGGREGRRERERGVWILRGSACGMSLWGRGKEREGERGVDS
jgi:hypothetical protein